MAKKKAEVKEDSTQATTPIPVMTEDEEKAKTARDFNVTSGQDREGAEADDEVEEEETATEKVFGTEKKTTKVAKNNTKKNNKSENQNQNQEEEVAGDSNIETAPVAETETEDTLKSDDEIL